MQTALKKEIVANISTHVGQKRGLNISLCPKCGLHVSWTFFINKNESDTLDTIYSFDNMLHNE